MTNEWIFYTQLGSVLVFIISLFVLYRLLVEKKEATIQFLEKQLQAAKEEKPDVVLKQLSERVQIARDEMERLAKDKESLEGMGKKVAFYVDSLVATANLQQELIKWYENQTIELLDSHQEYSTHFRKDLVPLLEKILEAGNMQIYKDKKGVIQKVTISPLNTD